MQVKIKKGLEKQWAEFSKKKNGELPTRVKLIANAIQALNENKSVQTAFEGVLEGQDTLLQKMVIDGVIFFAERGDDVAEVFKSRLSDLESALVNQHVPKEVLENVQR